MPMATLTHNAPLHWFHITTFFMRHFFIVCWNSSNLSPPGSSIHVHYYNRIVPRHDMKLNIFVWIPSNILSSLITRVPTSMATQFLSLPFYNSSRVLEGPRSIMGSPLPTLSWKHVCPQCIQLNVILIIFFFSQSLLIDQCTHDTIGSWIFLQRF